MSFQAKYKGFCIPCDEDIFPGEWITDHPKHGYIHEECTDIEAPSQKREKATPDGSPRVDVLPRGKTAKDRCNRCFMVHSTGQADCE